MCAARFREGLPHFLGMTASELTPEAELGRLAAKAEATVARPVKLKVPVRLAYTGTRSRMAASPGACVLRTTQ